MSPALYRGMYTRHNLHEAINSVAMRDGDSSLGADDLTRTGMYPELEQVHHREGGKTYLFIVDHGDRDSPTGLVSDVAVLDFETGRFSVIPEKEVTGEEPWLRAR